MFRAFSVFLCLAVAGPGIAATIDFEGFSHGDRIHQFTQDGVGIRIEVSGGINEAWAFDTTLDNTRDSDLEGPFRHKSGRGPKLSFGSALIIQENRNTTADDNARGGIVTFFFDQVVNVMGFDVLDDATVRVSSTDTTDRFRASQRRAENRYGSYDTSSFFTSVTDLSFRLDGSGALDNLRFAARTQPPIGGPLPAVPLPPGLLLLGGGLAALGLARQMKPNA